MNSFKQESNNWTFLSNHSHVLLCLASDSSMRMRDIAQKVGITERAVQRIIADLTEAGYIDRFKNGRCNSYEIHREKHLRHPIEENKLIEDLISLIDLEKI
ncbi:MAG: helix-turn-helix transcriptional regulator [Candidatus Rifleibacteriota bacterium]